MEMTMKRTEAKLRLERFISSPSTETLQSFIKCIKDDRCLYAACVNPRFATEQECPEQCEDLSGERILVFRDFLCTGNVDYLDAWKNHPAELVLHLIQFNSYAESMLAKKGIMERTEGKLRLERFIKSPSEETLQSFVECIKDDYCLYAACVNPHFAAERECTEQCENLSEERILVFKDFLCTGNVDYLKAWREHPAELVLHLIRFNSYIESTY
jgi:hypothetical protein